MKKNRSFITVTIVLFFAILLLSPQTSQAEDKKTILFHLKEVLVMMTHISA